MAISGFYIPGSKSGSYVANKRDEEGSLAYEGAQIGIGLEKQAALQNLSKSYESTIENAYASYLSNQRDINASAMGQGYKEAYRQAQQQNLVQNIAEAGNTAASARAEIESGAAEAQETLDTRYQTEVKNLDRVVNSMNDYLTYVNSLTNEAGEYYFTEGQKALGAEGLRDTLYTMDPKSFRYYNEETGQYEQGRSYYDWLYNQSQNDEDFSNWLAYGGGWQDFTNMMAKNQGISQTERKSAGTAPLSYEQVVSKYDQELKFDSKLHSEEIKNLLNSTTFENEEAELEAVKDLKNKIDEVDNLIKKYSKSMKGTDDRLKAVAISKLDRSKFEDYNKYYNAVKFIADNAKYPGWTLDTEGDLVNKYLDMAYTETYNNFKNEVK